MRIPERWRKELKRLSGFHPSDRVLERARLGPVSSVREPSSAPRMVVIVVAFAVFASAGVLMWRAFTPGGGPATVWEPGYPSPPASGYYILFPDQAERSQVQGETFRVRVTALTNLPDGTLLDITTTDEGTCCIPVKDSKIRFTTQDGACYGLIGQHPEGSTFDVTITAKPSFEPWIISGVGPGPSPKAPQQPDSVVDVLGRDFDNLSGDQTQTQGDGSKWLVATSTVPWPQPRCGEDPIPLFGGEVCDPNQFQQQLQGDDLFGVMDEVVGTISQGRMCEFWSVMLPPDVEAQHPWPEFSSEWHTWLLQQDFSDAEPASDWSQGALHWVESGSTDNEGGQTTVDIVHDGVRIATLVLQPLPDYCPKCEPNVVPFWGVVSWHLGGSEAEPGASSSPAATDAFAACPDASYAITVTPADREDSIRVAEQYLWGPDARAVLDPVATDNGLNAGSGTGDETVSDAHAGSKDALVPAACGTEVAAATYAVTFDDGTTSASLDFTIYVIKRPDGWKVWGMY
jgi:hypothetical protein